MMKIHYDDGSDDSDDDGSDDRDDDDVDGSDDRDDDDDVEVYNDIDDLAPLLLYMSYVAAY